jgi:hypothetical protein
MWGEKKLFLSSLATLYTPRNYLKMESCMSARKKGLNYNFNLFQNSIVFLASTNSNYSEGGEALVRRRALSGCKIVICAMT